MIYKEKNKNQVREYLVKCKSILFDVERHNICMIGKDFEICVFYIDREFFIEILDIAYKLDINKFLLNERV